MISIAWLNESKLHLQHTHILSFSGPCSLTFMAPIRGIAYILGQIVPPWLGHGYNHAPLIRNWFWHQKIIFLPYQWWKYGIPPSDCWVSNLMPYPSVYSVDEDIFGIQFSPIWQMGLQYFWHTFELWNNETIIMRVRHNWFQLEILDTCIITFHYISHIWL